VELDNPDALFAQGVAAITFRESWYAAWLEKNAPNIKFKVFPLPKEKMEPGVSNNFPWAINVNKDIKESDKKWLWEFFRWYVNSPEIRKEHFLGSKMLPCYNDVLDDPFFKSRPEFEAWKTMSAGRMAPTYYIPPAQQVLHLIGDATLAVLYNKQDAKSALDTAAAKIDEILVKYK
jgi:ABC-type glycerol-3-phosphate transport system substrate-binding protein